jgi:hypothetical protein
VRLSGFGSRPLVSDRGWQTRLAVVRIRSSSVPLRAGCNRRQRRSWLSARGTLSRVFTSSESALDQVTEGRRKAVSGSQPSPRGCDGAGGLWVASVGCILECRVNWCVIRGGDKRGGGNIFEQLGRVSSERSSERRPSFGGRSGLFGSRTVFGRGRPGEFGAPSRDWSNVAAARFMASRGLPAMHASSIVVSIQR